MINQVTRLDTEATKNMNYFFVYVFDITRQTKINEATRIKAITNFLGFRYNEANKNKISKTTTK